MFTLSQETPLGGKENKHSDLHCVCVHMLIEWKGSSDGMPHIRIEKNCTISTECQACSLPQVWVSHSSLMMHVVSSVLSQTHWHLVKNATSAGWETDININFSQHPHRQCKKTYFSYEMLDHSLILVNIHIHFKIISAALLWHLRCASTLEVSSPIKTFKGVKKYPMIQERDTVGPSIVFKLIAPH